MPELLSLVLKLSLVLFMVGNLLDMGLILKAREAFAGLRNMRFVMQSVLWGFVLCPAFAYLLSKIVPFDPAYGTGLILLGMAPCAPFLPPMVARARGDMGYAAAFMLLASIVTVAYMPFAVPFMVKGLTTSAWAIAKPLLFFVLIPLAIGMLIQRMSARVAAKAHPVVKKITGIATIIMLILCVVVYGKGFLGAVGTYAIGTQILFFSFATAASFALSFGLPMNQRSVLSLGMSTRNLGAAFAPLFAASAADERAIVMVALGVPMQTVFSLMAARWFARRASRDESASREIGAMKEGTI